MSNIQSPALSADSATAPNSVKPKTGMNREIKFFSSNNKIFKNQVKKINFKIKKIFFKLIRPINLEINRSNRLNNFWIRIGKVKKLYFFFIIIILYNI